MSLDAQHSRLKKRGRVIIDLANNSIEIHGFEGDNCSCRDIATLACLEAAHFLTIDALANIESPGGSSAVVE